MCDRQEIQYNFQQALTLADKLDDVADCLRRISENSMEESMKTLTSAWNGESAIVFLEKEDLLKNNIKDTAVNIRYIADTLRHLARNVYNAEMEALGNRKGREKTSGDL